MTVIQESEFNQHVDDLLIQIEDAIDDSEADIDYETAAGILTLTFADGSKIIINRQTPMRQIWVAARSGGFHFDYHADSDAWLNDTNQEEFYIALSRYCTEQAGEEIHISP